MTRRILRTCLFALCLVPFANRALMLAAEPELPTPLLLSVPDPPAPFTGSDQRIHLVYELWITNFSNGDVSIQNIAILGDSTILHELNAAEIARRLQPGGQREAVGVLPKSTQALLFIHFELSPGAAVPLQISHRITAHFAAAPPGHQELTETGGTTSIDPRPIMTIGPPSRATTTSRPTPAVTRRDTRVPPCLSTDASGSRNAMLWTGNNSIKTTASTLGRARN